MRILITGGAGCLGSNLIEHLLPEGNEILVIDNLATGRREVVPPVDGLKLVEGTIADASLVDHCFEEFAPEVAIHSAASYKEPFDWEEDVATNVAECRQATYNLEWYRCRCRHYSKKSGEN